MRRTGQIEVRRQPLAAYPLERGLHCTHDHIPHGVLKADTLDGVVVPEGLGLL